jgi:hypothetical protein
MHIDSLPDHRRNLVRWSELAADSALARLPFRIETDRLGRIIMSPPSHFDHTWRAAKINRLLREYLPQGEVPGETPLSTSDGVKVMDLAWLSAGYAQLLEEERPVASIKNAGVLDSLSVFSELPCSPGCRYWRFPNREKAIVTPKLTLHWDAIGEFW